MAKFHFNKPNPKFVIESATQVVMPNPAGIPVVVNRPVKMIEVKNYTLDTKEYVKTHPNITEEEVINRLRTDRHFGTSEIQEITEADQRAIEIKQKKLKEAEEEIKKLTAETEKLKI